jgi:hypothetical protein
MFLFWKRLDWRLIPVAGLLAALTFVPYFLSDAQRDWRNVQRFAEMMQQPASVSTDALYATWIISTGLDLDWVTGPDRYPEFAATTSTPRWLFTVEGALVIAASLFALGLIFRHFRQHRATTPLPDEEAALLMLLTWLTVIILFQTRYTVPPAPHYFTTVFPAPFILIGWLVARTWRALKRGGPVAQVLPLLVVGAIAVAQVYEITALLRYVGAHDTLRGYGTPIGYTVRAAEAAKRLSEEMHNAEVILVSEGDEPRMFEMPAVADVLLYGVPHRAMDIRNAVILSASPAVYWSTYQMTPGETLLASFVEELPDEEIPLREGLRSYRFYRWPGGVPEISEAQLLTNPKTWANGAQLIAYQLSGEVRPGATLRWTLIWRPTDTPSEDTYYHWFNHLVDEHGELWSQQDGPSVLPAYWRASDTILNWFEVPIPGDALPGVYRMRVGMYSYPALENVPLIDETCCQPPIEWVEIGPIAIGR